MWSLQMICQQHSNMSCMFQVEVYFFPNTAGAGFVNLGFFLCIFQFCILTILFPSTVERQIPAALMFIKLIGDLKRRFVPLDCTQHVSDLLVEVLHFSLRLAVISLFIGLQSPQLNLQQFYIQFSPSNGCHLQGKVSWIIQSYHLLFCNN